MNFIPEVEFTYFDDPFRSYDIASVFNEVMINDIIVGDFEKPVTYKGKSLIYVLCILGRPVPRVPQGFSRERQ